MRWNKDCFHTRAKVRNLNYRLNCAIWIIIRMTVFWTVCIQNFNVIAWFELHNSNDGSDHHLNCPFQITHLIKALQFEFSSCVQKVSHSQRYNTWCVGLDLSQWNLEKDDWIDRAPGWPCPKTFDSLFSKSDTTGQFCIISWQPGVFTSAL